MFSGYIIFNIVMIFVITWLFFGGYKKFIPTRAVEKFRGAKTKTSSAEGGEERSGQKN
jgi:NADH:ubiquinone oxidoreductase subunit H